MCVFNACYIITFCLTRSHTFFELWCRTLPYKLLPIRFFIPWLHSWNSPQFLLFRGASVQHLNLFLTSQKEIIVIYIGSSPKIKSAGRFPQLDISIQLDITALPSHCSFSALSQLLLLGDPATSTAWRGVEAESSDSHQPCMKINAFLLCKRLFGSEPSILI